MLGGNHMNDSEIDAAILAVAEPQWHKVARIVVDVAKRLGSRLPAGDEGYELIAKRIEILIHDGRLIAQGDINEWRYSEVHLP